MKEFLQLKKFWFELICTFMVKLKNTEIICIGKEWSFHNGSVLLGVGFPELKFRFLFLFKAFLGLLLKDEILHFFLKFWDFLFGQLQIGVLPSPCNFLKPKDRWVEDEICFRAGLVLILRFSFALFLYLLTWEFLLWL